MDPYIDFAPWSISKTSIALDGGSIPDVLSVVGGPCLITCMIMEITEAVSNNSCTMAWESDPTIGSQTPIGIGLDIANLALGDFVYSEGDGSALVIAATGIKLPRGMNAAAGNANTGIVVPVGGLDITMQNSDPTSGIGSLFLRYQPLSPASRITV